MLDQNVWVKSGGRPDFRLCYAVLHFLNIPLFYISGIVSSSLLFSYQLTLLVLSLKSWYLDGDLKKVGDQDLRKHLELCRKQFFIIEKNVENIWEYANFWIRFLKPISSIYFLECYYPKIIQQLISRNAYFHGKEFLDFGRIYVISSAYFGSGTQFLCKPFGSVVSFVH